MIIAIDFDGTLVEHLYPDIGLEVPYAFETLLDLQAKGHKLILLTMRSGKELSEAIEYCKNKGMEFWSINNNPEQSSWTESRKIYAHVYIDDANAGCPLKPARRLGIRPMVDWLSIRKYLDNKFVNS